MTPLQLPTSSDTVSEMVSMAFFDLRGDAVREFDGRVGGFFPEHRALHETQVTLRKSPNMLPSGGTQIK